MNLAVVGSRTWTDEAFVYEKLNEFAREYNITAIISGGARGVDTIASNWSVFAGIPAIIHLPDWGKYGKSAGYQRNKLIVRDADRMMAFIVGNSKGTQHSIDIARAVGIPVEVYEWEHHIDNANS